MLAQSLQRSSLVRASTLLGSKTIQILDLHLEVVSHAELTTMHVIHSRIAGSSRAMERALALTKSAVTAR